MIDVISLYEDLKKYISVSGRSDKLFYDAPEGQAQVDIVKDMLTDLVNNLE